MKLQSGWIGVFALFCNVIAFGLVGSFSLPQPAHAFSGPALGWCTVTNESPQCFGDPVAACEKQHADFGGPGAFNGAHPSARWDIYGCEWEYVPGHSYPTWVGFECRPGYKLQPFGQCLLDDLPLNRDQCGANPHPNTLNPIDIMTGAKLFTANDFTTADNSLSLDRNFVSRPFGGLTKDDVALSNLSLGNWSAFFDVQIQLASNWDVYRIVTVVKPDGTTDRFYRKSDGTMSADLDGIHPYPDSNLRFIGTWPALSTVTSSITVWEYTDRNNDVWTLQTRSEPGLPAYRIGKPTSVRRHDGTTLKFTYDASGILAAISDQAGKSLTLAWNTENVVNGTLLVGVRAVSLASVGLPGGYSVRYSYDSISGRVSRSISDRLIRVEYVDPSGIAQDRVDYQYSNPDYPTYVTGILDRNGAVRWRVTYDEQGHAIRSEGPNGENATSVSYSPVKDTFSRTVTNTLGRQTTYSFRREWPIARLEAVDGLVTTHCPASAAKNTYDAHHFVATSTDEEGRITAYTRNSIGQPTKIVEASGTASARTTQLTWHPSFNLVSERAISGLTEKYGYDSLGRLTTFSQVDTTTQTVPYTTKGQTRTWAYTYGLAGGELGKVVSVDGPLSGAGDTTRYAYNASGYLASVTDEIGKVTNVTAWDWRGAPLTVIDPNNVSTTFTYDIHGRPLSVTINPGSVQSKYVIAYDAVGNVSRVTLPRGGYLQYTYDAASRLTQVRNEKNETIALTPNPMGQPTLAVVKNASGLITQQQAMAYDELGRIIQTLGAASATPTVYAYDKVDNPTSTTDGRGKLASKTFDALNRVITETDPERKTVTKAFDVNDEVTVFKDGRFLATRFTRDGFGEVIREVSPDRGTLTYWYDDAGRMVRMIDGDNQQTDFSYDHAGRLLTKTFLNAPAENLTYTYDNVASGNKGATRLTKVTEQSGSSAFTYDALGHVSKDAKNIQGKTYNVLYFYDVNGDLTKISYPSGRTVNIARDKSGVITGITTSPNSATAAVAVASSATFQPFGPLKGLTYGNGLTLVRGYNANGWLTRTQVASGAVPSLDLGYRYFDDGRLAAIDDNAATGRSVQITLSDAGRLTGATGSWGKETYRYDAAGNRTGETLTVGTKVTADNQVTETTSNRLVKTTDVSGATKRAFTYRAGGDLSTDTAAGVTYTYQYNARKRLTQVMFGPVATSEYGYDFNEQRVSRKVYGLSTATIHYVFDQRGHLLAEHNGVTGAVIREYIWLDDMPIAVIDASSGAPQTYYVHTGHLNEPQVMTDAAKAKVWDGYVTPFGSAKILSAGGVMDLRLPGQWAQAEAAASGLSQNWHRDYDPTLGRYAEADPLGINAGQSLYTYVDGRVYDRTDPLGLATMSTNVTKKQSKDCLPIVITPDILNRDLNEMKNRWDNSDWAQNNMNYSDNMNYWNNQNSFDYNGHALSGHDVNYYYQGALSNYYGRSQIGMYSKIYAYTLVAHGRLPTQNERYMSGEGYRNTKQFFK